MTGNNEKIDILKCNIREATIDDYESLNELFDEGDKLHRESLPDIFKKPDGPVRELEYFKSLLENHEIAIFLAILDEKTIGVVVGQIMESPNIPIMKTNRYGFIDNLVVNPQYRKNGIAKKLLSRLHDWFKEKNLSEARLNVFDFNSGAISFYEDKGYTSYSRRMRKKL